jgi:hypothetical protein
MLWLWIVTLYYQSINKYLFKTWMLFANFQSNWKVNELIWIYLTMAIGILERGGASHKNFSELNNWMILIANDGETCRVNENHVWNLNLVCVSSFSFSFKGRWLNSTTFINITIISKNQGNENKLSIEFIFSCDCNLTTKMVECFGIQFWFRRMLLGHQKGFSGHATPRVPFQVLS